MWAFEQFGELGHSNWTMTKSLSGFLMKRYNDLYDKVCSLENLQKAFRKARKGKSQKQYVKDFENILEQNILQLQKELQTQTYKPMPFSIFVVRDPKTRLISAPDFRDRIVHHAICSIIEPIFEKTFIYDSYANRKGKGTHKALKRFDVFKRRVTRNGAVVKNPKSNNMVVGYALKCDIKHYFPSVDHETLLKILGKKIRDKQLMWLLKEIITSYGKQKGMSIGSLTSQYFANIYLNELDNFVKHILKAKYYIRYLDDFVVLDSSKQRLEDYKNQINSFLKTIKLELHEGKSKIIPLHNGVSMLGFRIFYYHKLLKKSNISMTKRKIENFKKLYKYRYITKEKIAERMGSWCAHAKWGNTYKLRKKIVKDLNF